MGAKCEACGKDTQKAVGCNSNPSVEFPDGTILQTIPYANEFVGKTPGLGTVKTHRCHDCGVRLGKKHHPGCDMERCPRCKGQMIGCDCLFDPTPA